MKATLVRDNLPNFTGRAALYRLDPPLSIEKDWDKETKGKITEYVIVSATNAMFGGPETYIFPASADGEVTDWGELEGSYKGDYDHVVALAGAGYAVVVERRAVSA